MSSVIRATDWRTATVAAIAPETPRAATLTLDVPGWNGHRAGQHVDVRLTADDGYRAQRSYSIASAPEDDQLMITVEELVDGEVSPWMVEVAAEGDQFEVRGPFGGWFVWDASQTQPLFLVAGGSGLVPLMSMLRHRRNAGSEVPARLLISAREADDVLYARELERIGAEVTHHLHAPRARGLERLRAPRRPRDAAGARAARRAHLRLRAHDLRGDGGQRPRGARPRAGEHQDGALRRDWRLTMEHLDGNAAAGDLSEVFTLEATTAMATCAGCGATGAMAQAMSTSPAWAPCCAAPTATRCCCGSCARAGRCAWRCAASGCCAGKAPLDDAARVALEDLLSPRTAGVDVEVDHRYIVFAPLTASKTAYSEVVAQM